MTPPKTPYEATVLALELAITAPTEEKARECSEMAEGIASGLSEAEVEKAKAQALANIKGALKP